MSLLTLGFRMYKNIAFTKNGVDMLNKILIGALSVMLPMTSFGADYYSVEDLEGKIPNHHALKSTDKIKKLDKSELSNPDSEIKSLRISTPTLFDGRIYANGNMQAEMIVSYELVDGADVGYITLHRLYTREDINYLGWKTEEHPNEYYKVIANSESNEGVNDSGTTTLSSGNVPIYATTDTNASIDICVRLTTRNGYSRDTCDGNTNQSYVSLLAVEPVVYPDENFEVEVSKSINSGYSENQLISLYTDDPRFTGIAKILDNSPVVFDSGIPLELDTTLLSDHDFKGVGGSSHFILFDKNVSHYNYINDNPSWTGRKDARWDTDTSTKLILRAAKYKAITPDFENTGAVLWKNNYCYYQGPQYYIVICFKPTSGNGLELFLADSEYIYTDLKAFNKTEHVIRFNDFYGTTHTLKATMDSNGDVTLNGVKF